MESWYQKIGCFSFMPPDHFYRKPKLAFWEQLGTAIRQAKAFIANSKEQLLNIPMEAMTSALPKLAEMYPMETPIKRDICAAKLQDFLNAPTLPLAKWLLQSAGRILQAKVRELSSESSKAFSAFALSACTARGEASGMPSSRLGSRTPP